MKKYIFLLAGLILAFQACKKSDNNNSSSSSNNNNNVPVLKACFVAAHTLLDSGAVDTFNAAVCSENATSYAWLSTVDGSNGTGATWTKYFGGAAPRGLSYPIKLTVTGSNGAKKDTVTNVFCGFHKFTAFVINKLNINASSFYISYYPVNQSVTYTTDTFTTSKVTSGLPFIIPVNPASINPANNNTSKWLALVIDASTGHTYTSFSFTDNGVNTGETPYTRTFNAVSTTYINLNINYTISAN